MNLKAAKKDVSSSLPKVPVARLVGHDGPIQAVKFAANGKYCLTGGHDRTVRLWNPLRIDPAFPPPPLLPTGGSTTSTVNNDDDDDDVTIPFDSLARALPIQTYGTGYTHPISSIALDAASTTLAAASNRTLVITDIVTQQVKRRFQGHVGRINAVGISNGCETYLSGSYDATVKIWDGRSNSYEPIMTLQDAKDSITDLHVIQDDVLGNNNNNTALIRTASVDGMVRTYDLRKGNLFVDNCGVAITSMTPTYDGQCLAINCLDGILRLMELDTGELLNTYTSNHIAGQYGLQCCVTADDATIVTGSEDGKVVFYDIVRGTSTQTLHGHTKPTCSIATHPNSDYSSVVITASYDGTAVVWANHEGFMKWED